MDSNELFVKSIPVYYISFNKNNNLENSLNNIGFKSVNHFKAIDGRKFDVDELIENNTITIRSYNDLIFGRHEHTGMPTLGAIGCTLSHLTLWKLCVDYNMPYIIICEDDINIDKDLSKKDIKNIVESITKENGVFVSSNFSKENEIMFYGTHFYILSQGACKQLIKYALPIDVQTDSYIANISRRNLINLNGYRIYNQKFHKSSIQIIDIKTGLPKNIWFYMTVLLFIIFIVCVAYILFRKNRICKIDLKKCESSI
jgi:GR25 family glycosyltransferase involved in LPS biosynthesis